MSGTPWERILQYHKTTSRPIEVCVGPSADAAAACRTLTDLLSGFLVPASHHPIHSYEALAAIAAAQRANDDGSQHLYVLIGIGAAVELRHCFQFATDIVVVLDSYRPVHLNNLRFDSANLLLWDADNIKSTVSATFAALRRTRKRRRSSSREADFDDTSSDERTSDGDISDADGEEEEDDDWMNAEKADPELEKLYYAAEHCSRSSAVELRNLAVSISRLKDQFNWNAAVGVTDLFLRRGLDLAAFTVEMGRLRDAVALQNATRRTNLSDVTNAGARRSTHEVKLQAIDDDQLFLLRHWTLWNAIWHDKHASSLLGLHHVDEGIEKLRFVLATCGISIKLAEQGWMEVPQEERRRAMGLLRKELKEIAAKSAAHHSYQPVLPAISRSVGFATEVSSFDAVHLFNAVLAHPSSTSYGEDVSASEKEQQEAAANIRQYWKAYEVLQCDSNSPLFAQALQECKASARTIATATSALMQRGSILTTRAVHYSLLTDANRRAVALESFFTPPRLRLLGDHLLVALAAERDPKRFHMKPLLLACAIPNSDEFLVVCSHAGTNASSVMGRARPKPLPLIKDFGDSMASMGGLLRPSVDRLCVVLPTREQASLFCEQIHLRSVTKAVH
jgi:cell division control protein 45